MNKLRKPRAIVADSSQICDGSGASSSVSRGLYNSQTRTGLDQDISSPNSVSPRFGNGTNVAPHSRYTIEQYWAARALTAETLLSSRNSHQQELRSLSFAAETKRSKALAELTKAYEAKHVQLERTIAALLLCLLFHVVLAVYLAIQPTHAQRHRWSLPPHFTIPILSPFTSVVEHELSVIGSKSVTIFLVICAGLGYMGFRHWHSRIQHR